MLCSCGEYQRVYKSDDVNYKFDYAKRAFEQKKIRTGCNSSQRLYFRFKGSDKAEESLYLLAMSHYENKDYATSGVYFKSYYTRYPKGKYTEAARFFSDTAIISIRPTLSSTRPVLSRLSRSCRLFSISSQE